MSIALRNTRIGIAAHTYARTRHPYVETVTTRAKSRFSVPEMRTVLGHLHGVALTTVSSRLVRSGAGARDPRHQSRAGRLVTDATVWPWASVWRWGNHIPGIVAPWAAPSINRYAATITRT